MPIFSREDLYGPNGRKMVRGIFCENLPYTGPLTYHKEDRKGKLSLYKLYMLYYTDPSEVSFAEAVFGDIPFWHELSSSSFFKEYIEEWRFIASEKRKELAFKAIVKEVTENGKSSFAAAKFLIDEPWKVGRTLKEKRAMAKRNEEATNQAYQTISVTEDFNRLKEQGVLN